jgi:hypothetical protein
MAKRRYSKPYEYDPDPRFNVKIHRTINGAVFDHHEAAQAWDDYNKEHPLSKEKLSDE